MKNTSKQLHNKQGKILLGFSLLFLGLLLILGKKGPTTLDSDYTFAKEPVVISGFDTEVLDESLLPQKILISEVGIDLKVKKAEIINGYWEVFPDLAGWGAGSGLPGRVGNQVIFAHAREGLFLPLKKSKLDMKVYIFTKDSWFEYKIDEIKEVYPNQTEVIAESNDERLTLYTCSGFSDQKRLIVVAHRTLN